MRTNDESGDPNLLVGATWHLPEDPQSDKHCEIMEAR